MLGFRKKGESNKKGKSKEIMGEENFENKEKSRAVEVLKAEGELNPDLGRKRKDLPGRKVEVIRVSKEPRIAEPEMSDRENELRNPNKKIFMPRFLQERGLRENVQVEIVRERKESGVSGHFFSCIDPDFVKKIQKSEEKLEFAFPSPKESPLVRRKRKPKPEFMGEYQSFMLPPAIRNQFSPILTIKTFLELMRNGDVESIRFLLPKEDPKSFIEALIQSSQEADDHKRSLFHIAVLEQRHEVIQLFRELGVSINQCDKRNQTPLHYAARYLSHGISSHERTILELLKFDNAVALLTAEDDFGMTPIKYATLSKDEEFFAALEKFASSDEDSLMSDVASMKSR